MNPFKFRLTDRYSLSIPRLLIGTVIFLTGLCRKAIFSVFSIESPFLNILFAVISLLGLAYILTALLEITTLRERRRHQTIIEMPADRVRTLPYKLFPAEKVLSALESEPILILQIISNDRLLLVSAASDSREVHDSLFKSHTEYFDKAYFINDTDEFPSFNDFRAALAPFIQNGMIAVHKIDDVPISDCGCNPFGE